jgi:hypothetical protein
MCEKGWHLEMFRTIALGRSCVLSRALIHSLYVWKVVYISPSILTPLVSLSTLIDFTILQNTTTDKMMFGKDETRKTLSEVFDGVSCVLARGLICGLCV